MRDDEIVEVDGLAVTGPVRTALDPARWLRHEAVVVVPVFEEKRREDAIRGEGWRMVRWIWSELPAAHRIAARVRRATAGRR